MQFHPLAEEYPMMPAKELSRLEDAMRNHGYDKRFPVVVYGGRILDGRNRWLASQAAGVKAPTVEFKGTEEEAAAFVRLANEERRHLATEWLEARRKERVVRVAEAKADGKSTRQIAEDEGVSQTQVVADLKEAIEQGCSIEPDGGQVKAKGGRKYPSKRKPPSPEKKLNKLVEQGKVSESTAEAVKSLPDEQKEKVVRHLAGGGMTPEDIERARDEADMEVEAEQVEAAVDDLGRPLPERARSAFAGRVEVLRVCRLIDSARRAVESLASNPAAAFMRLHSPASQLKQAKDHLWANRPTHVCPYCKGEKDECDACKGRGWVYKSAYEQSPGVWEGNKT